jgi:hypothetical protein
MFMFDSTGVADDVKNAGVKHVCGLLGPDVTLVRHVTPGSSVVALAGRTPDKTAVVVRPSTSAAPSTKLAKTGLIR